MPVLKVRKRIFNEMKDILIELKSKAWFSNEKAISQVRSIAIITMQLLRESPKAPFIR